MMAENPVWRRRLQRAAGRLRRGFGHAGPDRDSLLLLGKGVLAATLAWLVADTLLHAPSATFAPFSALLMVQATVAQSVYQALRYVAAVVLGVVLAGVAIPLLGQQLWVFALLLLLASAIGRWPRLGSQGSQVAVAALFAYAAIAQVDAQTSKLVQVASIAGLVVLGSVLGVVVNLTVVPPLRYRSAQYGISVLAQSLCDLLSDISRGIRTRVPDEDETHDWSRRADRLPQSVSQARSAVENAAETVKFNPRRLLVRDVNSFEGYRSIVNALHRSSEQVCSMTKGLYYASRQDKPVDNRDRERFLEAYAQVIDGVTDVSRILGRLHSTDDLRENSELAASLTECETRIDRLAGYADDQRLDGPQQWPVYGGLRTDIYRLVQEFREAQTELDRLVRA